MILADDSATKTRVENADGTVDLICIVCPSGCRIKIDTKNGYKVTGNTCPRGEAYGKKELISPTRVLTSTAIIKGAPISRVSVKTNKDIPKSSIFAVMKTLDNLELKAPVKIGDTVVSKVEGLEADFVVTKPLP
ncbi:MAG: DUF1667 domain-containing protein [Elusimicrobiota bacterium]|nr:DUF1667 domain-containing protein [Elusimicrobiota bacterium]